MINKEEAIIHNIKIPPRIFDELDKIRSSLKDSTTVGNGLNYKIRSSKIAWIYEDSIVAKFCRHWVDVINEDNFKFDLHSSFDRNSIQYSEYGVNDHYIWHVDLKETVPSRKLSFTLMLNDDYEGGEFEIGRYSLGKHELTCNTVSCDNKTGTLIVFPATLPHRVKPVSKGIRKSLVGWITGPPLR